MDNERICFSSFRRAGLVLCAALAISVLSVATPVFAQTQLTPADFKRVNALSGNTVAWAVLRKAVALGLDEAGLTEIAGQPDSVDTIATIIALEDPQGRLVPILSGAARGGLMSVANPDLVSSLGLDGSRPKGIACLVYGRDPEARTLLANLVALSASERQACAAHYARIRDHWMAAVEKFLQNPAEQNPSLVEVELDPASGMLASARSVLIAGETVHEVGYFLRRHARFARPLTLRGTTCGAPRVDIDPANGHLIVCYDLLAELVTQIGRTIGEQAR